MIVWLHIDITNINIDIIAVKYAFNSQRTAKSYVMCSSHDKIQPYIQDEVSEQVKLFVTVISVMDWEGQAQQLRK